MISSFVTLTLIMEGAWVGARGSGGSPGKVSRLASPMFTLLRYDGDGMGGDVSVNEDCVTE